MPRHRFRTRAAAFSLALVVVGGCSTTADDAPIRVGFILVGASDDLGYNQAIWEGADELARALPDVEVLRTENVPEDDAAIDAMESIIAQGASVVFATSFGHRDAAVAVARAHPDVVVVHQGATPTEDDLDNYGSYFGAHSAAAFGAGLVAAHTSSSGALGMVAAFPIPATYNNVNAFQLGAASVNPNATTTIEFTGTWCDPPTQRAAADRLIAAGIDVIAQHQDCTRTIVEASRDAGIGTVGYHADASEVGGDAWLIGAVWTWGRVYVDIVNVALDGKFPTSKYRDGFVGTVAMGNDPFVLTEPGPRVSDEAAAELDAVFAAFERGERHPFTGPLSGRDGIQRVGPGDQLTQDEIDAMDWFVAGVLGSP